MFSAFAMLGVYFLWLGQCAEVVDFLLCSHSIMLNYQQPQFLIRTAFLRHSKLVTAPVFFFFFFFFVFFFFFFFFAFFFSDSAMSYMVAAWYNLADLWSAAYSSTLPLVSLVYLIKTVYSTSIGSSDHPTPHQTPPSWSTFSIFALLDRSNIHLWWIVEVSAP